MLHISFNLNQDTLEVSDIKVLDMSHKYKNVLLPIIKIEDNRLCLSENSVKLLQVNVGDRLSINYLQLNNEQTIPVIGKSEVFLDYNAGNKLTKNYTVSFKGLQKTILSKYGTLFMLQEYKANMYKLISINEEELIQGNPDLEEEQNNIRLI